jgi:hypothetical protein
VYGICQNPSVKTDFKKYKNNSNIGLFADLQVVFRMLKPAKIKHYVLKFAARRFARLKASPVASLRAPPPAMSCGRLACRRPFDFLSHERVRLLCFFTFPFIVSFPFALLLSLPSPSSCCSPFPLFRFPFFMSEGLTI